MSSPIAGRIELTSGHHKTKDIAMAEKFDLYTFVAGAALERGSPFPLSCNCGGVVTIMPPFQDEFVICPLCESKIKMLVIEGDPGYIIGADPDGTPKLLPVQGSAKLHPGELSAAWCINSARLRTRSNPVSNLITPAA